MASDSTEQNDEVSKSEYWMEQEGVRLSPAQFLFQSPSVFPTDFIMSQQRDLLSSTLYPQFFRDASSASTTWKESGNVARVDKGYIDSSSFSLSSYSGVQSSGNFNHLQTDNQDSYANCDRTYDLFNGSQWSLRNLASVHEPLNPITRKSPVVPVSGREKENEEPLYYPETPQKIVQTKPSYKEILSKSASMSKISQPSPSSSPVQFETTKVGISPPKSSDPAKPRLSVRNSLPSTPTHGIQRLGEKKSLQDIDDEFVLPRDGSSCTNGWGAVADSGKKKTKLFDSTSGGPYRTEVWAEDGQLSNSPISEMMPLREILEKSVNTQNRAKSDSQSNFRLKSVPKERKSSCNGTLPLNETFTEKKTSTGNRKPKESRPVAEEGSDGSSSRSEPAPMQKKLKQKDAARKREDSERIGTKQMNKNGSKRKREIDGYGYPWMKIVQEISFKWVCAMMALAMWLVRLVLDVASLGLVASKDGISSFTEWFGSIGKTMTTAIFTAARLAFRNVYESYIKRFLTLFRRKNVSDDKKAAAANIPLPSTGEEAMRRLLACKGKDPYSILGVSRSCSDEEIKRYYRKQAILVHPDKNRQAGSEEAFKILAHAFECIGEPVRRQQYDQAEREKRLVQSADGELSDLLDALQRKMDEAVNTIKCTNCNQRHRRVKTGRPLYAGRFCGECNIYHQAKDGELWAESSWMGIKWVYLACMENTIFEITEWGNCQSGSLRHLKPNVHAVQYKLKPWSASSGTPNQEQRRNTYQDPVDLSDNEWDNLLAGMYKNCNFGHGNAGERAAAQRSKNPKRRQNKVFDFIPVFIGQ